MDLTSAETAHLLLSIVVLLAAAHLLGELFTRVHFPRTIGELLGGLLLGPTLLGAALPGVEQTLFPSDGTTPTVLGAFYQLGLIFLMCGAGVELGSVFRGGERRPAVTIIVTGVLLPFLAGIFLFRLAHFSHLEGPAHNVGALRLVFAASIAVTSIPVISRIMMDIGIIDTPFARIVLNAAVIEDVVMYAILAIAVGLAQSTSGEFGLASVLGFGSTSVGGTVYYAAATLAVLALAFMVRMSIRSAGSNLGMLSAAAPQIGVVLAIVTACMLLSVTPVFGGFVGGIVLGSISDGRTTAVRQSINRFTFGFFVPIYFAIVGLRLNLLHSIDVVPLGGFLLFACVVKFCSVYLGARIAGETARTSQNLAIAMNARGGPGIVLASVAYDAHIIDGRFYAYLIVLSIVTSLMAGFWLERAVRRGEPLRDWPTPAVGRAPAPAPLVATHVEP